MRLNRRRHRLAMVLPEAGAALHIREQDVLVVAGLIDYAGLCPAPVRELGALDRWSCEKSGELGVVTGESMVAARG